MQSYVTDTLQDEYKYTIKQLQLQDSIFRKDSADLSKRPKALELATAELNKLKVKYFNWQQYQQEAQQAKQDQLLLPYRQKIFEALKQVIDENKYTWVLNPAAVTSPYYQPPLEHNLAIRVAKKLNLPLPKEIEEAFRVATGVDKLKPGITGWAQINGRDELSFPQKVKLEQEYLYRKSFLFDFEILIKTFKNVIFSKGVRH